MLRFLEGAGPAGRLQSNSLEVHRGTVSEAKRGFPSGFY